MVFKFNTYRQCSPKLPLHLHIHLFLLLLLFIYYSGRLESLFPEVLYVVYCHNIYLPVT